MQPCACQNCTDFMLELFDDHVKMEKHTWGELPVWETKTYADWNRFFRELSKENNFCNSFDMMRYMDGVCGRISLNRKKYYETRWEM